MSFDVQITDKAGNKISTRQDPTFAAFFKDQISTYIIKILDCPSYSQKPSNARYNFQILLFVPYVRTHGKFIEPIPNEYTDIRKIDVLDSSGQSVLIPTAWVPSIAPKYRVAWPRVSPTGLSLNVNHE